MSLDRLDSSFLEETKRSQGDYQGILKRCFGWNIAGKDAARKRIQHIRAYLNWKGSHSNVEDTTSNMEEIVTKADGSVTTRRMMILAEEDSKDPNRVMTLMGFDPLQWKVRTCKTRRNDWDVTMKLRKVVGYDNSGRPIYEDNPDKRTNHAYMIELTVEPIQKALTSGDVARIFESLSAPTLKTYKREKRSGELLEVPIMDLHLGKLS